MEQTTIKLPRDRINTEDQSIESDTDVEEYTHPTQVASDLYNSVNDRFREVPLDSLKTLNATLNLRFKTKHVAIFKADSNKIENIDEDIVLYKNNCYIGHLIEVIGKKESPIFVVWYDKDIGDEITESSEFMPYFIPE